MAALSSGLVGTPARPVRHREPDLSAGPRLIDRASARDLSAAV